MKSLPIAILAAGTTAALSAAQDLSDRVVHLAQGCLSFRTGAQRWQADYRKRRRHLRFRPCRLRRVRTAANVCGKFAIDESWEDMV